jgi:hypothetical protein
MFLVDIENVEQISGNLLGCTDWFFGNDCCWTLEE